MNIAERKMVDILKDLTENYAVVGVKAEFEAEGTRTEELMRLKEICLAASSSLTLKIGGCEAIRDMFDARAVGVDHLVAPMVETPFALRKYLHAVDVVFPEDEREKVDFLVNIETITAIRNYDEMLAIKEIDRLNGVVIGRSDLTGSMNIDKKDINSEKVLNMTKDVVRKAKAKGLICVVGGTISVGSVNFLKELCAEGLDRYETRKVCFACREGLRKDTVRGINRALELELLWLQNKQNHYKSISEEDQKRINGLMERGQ